MSRSKQSPSLWFFTQPRNSARPESYVAFLVALLAVLAAVGPTRTFAQAGAVDSTFANGAPGLALTRLAVQPDGKILVGSGMNIAGQTTVSNVVRLNPDGDLDPTFTPGPGLLNITIIPGMFTNVGPGVVSALVVQPDGKILVGGTFNSVGGFARTNLVRLNTNGVLDTSFAGLANGSVTSILPLANGTIFIGGAFTSVGGVPRPGIARITSSGALDPSFVPNLGSYFGARVWAIAVQPGDGKILIAGGISYFNPVPTAFTAPVVRLETGGALDTSFTAGPLGNVTHSAQDMVLQADGKVVISSGLFNSIGGAPHLGIACLNSNGTLNASWPGTGVWATNSAYRNVSAMVAQPDGKILIGGRFEQYNGTTRIGVARLNVDGTLDSTFTGPATSFFQVGAMAMQSATKVIVGGNFTLGATPHSLLRLGGGNASPTLTFSLQAGNILHFDVPAGFKLQRAPTATGGWGDVPGSPPFDLPTTNAIAFFRLISI